jgi:pimeloyl-ACP methyl ester carboxylesterase
MRRSWSAIPWLAGAVALALALTSPQFVRGLVLLAPVSHPWPGGVHWYYSMEARPWIGWALRRFIVMPAGLLVLRAGVGEVFAPNAAPSAYIEATGLKLALRPKHFRATAEDVADLKPFVSEQASRYPGIAAPTEIVTGDCDGVVYAPIHSAGCARDIPNSVLTVLPGIGHSPHHSATESVVAAIVRAEQRAIARQTTNARTRIAAAG